MKKVIRTSSEYTLSIENTEAYQHLKDKIIKYIEDNRDNTRLHNYTAEEIASRAEEIASSYASEQIIDFLNNPSIVFSVDNDPDLYDDALDMFETESSEPVI